MARCRNCESIVNKEREDCVGIAERVKGQDHESFAEAVMEVKRRTEGIVDKCKGTR